MTERYNGDMITNLTTLPDMPVLSENIKIKRAFPTDKGAILQFVKENFDQGWVYETEAALMQTPPKCFIATENGKMLGFACFDASAKGFFGPTGVSEDARGKKIGAALLIRTLQSMREFGYGYAMIGWVSDAEMFYRKLVNAEYIKGGEPENSIYSNLISK